jgi:predicted O-methyltransferase YrrM
VTTTIDIHRAAEIPGWMERDELAVLAEFAAAARIVIEVGAWKGRSTRALADHCPGTVYTIDAWRGQALTDDGQPYPQKTEVAASFQKFLRDHLATGHVVAVRERSETALPRLLRELGRVADLIFIDGDHRYVACGAAAPPAGRRHGGSRLHEYPVAWGGAGRARALR